MSCRITGATLKNLNDIQKMKENEKDTQSFFPKLFKSNKSLIDEELPDPDLVRNIRAKFQKNLNSSLENNLHQNFGGSLQNVSTRKVEHRILRPLSVQCNTEDIINNTSDNSISQVKKKLTTESTDLTKGW